MPELGAIVPLLLEASLFSYIVFGILLFMSVISWSIMLAKFFGLNTAIFSSKRFYKKFNSLTKISQFAQLSSKYKRSYSAKIFEAAYEVLKQQDVSQDTLEIMIEKQTFEIIKTYEKGLSTLANISSTAPFVGLLGTVVGITTSFQNIGITGATSLAVVAPGISEALVATALGLFAAIPALWGYNLFRNKIRRIHQEMQIQKLDLLSRFKAGN